jgi:hypothetical protein
MHMKKNILILFVSLHESQVHFLYLHPLPRGLPPIQDMQPMFALSRVRKLFQKDNNVYFFCEWIATFTLICRKVIHSHRNNYLLGEATLYPRQRKEKSLHMHKQHVRTHKREKNILTEKLILYIYIYKEFNLIIIVEGRKLNTH